MQYKYNGAIILLLFIILTGHFCEAGGGPRSGRRYGFFIGGGSPPISLISGGLNFNPFARLKMIFETGAGFQSNSTGGSIDYLFNPDESFAYTLGLGFYHMHFDDPDLFFDDGKDESRNLKATAIRLGFDRMSAGGINFAGGVGFTMQRLFPKRASDYAFYPYLSLGYVF